MLDVSVSDVASGFRKLSDDEKLRCKALLAEAQIMVDAYNPRATDEAKRLVACRMVRRQLGSESDTGGVCFPMGSTQGTATALGYSQSWTMSGGAVGELYLSKLDKKLLGVGSKIGSHSPLEDLCND